MSRTFGALCAAVLMLGASGCRDMPAPPTEPERTEAPQNFPLQLTYSVEDDRAPIWSAAGDSVYYVAHSGLHEGRPVTELRAISRNAGIARALLPELRSAGDTIWLAEPQLSPDGRRLAFAQLEIYFTDELFAGSWQCTGDAAARRDVTVAPRLGIVRMHARTMGSTAPLNDGTEAYIQIQGRVPTGPTMVLVRWHPFQRLWQRERLLPFHPSWAPDGQRIAFSDGLRILQWQPGTEPQAIPGTEDALDPAWSPDGDRIAYTRVERTDSARAYCLIPGAFGPVIEQDRIAWETGARRILVTAPDGSGSVDLGIGEDPAWSPDGRYIYAVRFGEIWRILADGSGAVQIAGTTGGREPAVSPDGNHLAFARLTAKGDYDIWVVDIP